MDHVIDYKATGNLTKALLQAAPNGIDVYFDSVGGEHWRPRSRRPTGLPASRSVG